MTDIVVSDTNIFIDLMSVGLLDLVCNLPLQIHTVDYVVNEIKDSTQQEAIQALITCGKITVKEFKPEELMEIIGMYSARSNNVSVTDCSVWYYAKKNNYRLLTGDGKLRNSAISDGVQVSGILYLTDMLVDCAIVGKKHMSACLKKLISINSRLPKRIIGERILRYEAD